MSNLSFGINNSEDYFREKVLKDYESFKLDKLSLNAASNCAISSFHLIDWIFKEYYNHSTSDFGTFRDDMFLQCDSLRIMHDITNSIKHCSLSRKKSNATNSKLHSGSFDRSFDRSFDISIIEIEMDDGTRLFFEDEIKKVIDFWYDYFQRELNIEI